MKARIELLKKDDDLAAGKQVLEKVLLESYPSVSHFSPTVTLILAWLLQIFLQLMQCNSALYNGLWVSDF